MAEDEIDELAFGGEGYFAPNWLGRWHGRSIRIKAYDVSKDATRSQKVC
jgi:hypothetical protein